MMVDFVFEEEAFRILIPLKSDSYRVKTRMDQKEDMKMDLRRACMVKTLLKIRGRIFLSRGELMQHGRKIQ